MLAGYYRSEPTQGLDAIAEVIIGRTSIADTAGDRDAVHVIKDIRRTIFPLTGPRQADASEPDPRSWARQWWGHSRAPQLSAPGLRAAPLAFAAG